MESRPSAVAAMIQLPVLVAGAWFSLQEEDSHAVTLCFSISVVEVCRSQLDPLNRPL